MQKQTKGKDLIIGAVAGSVLGAITALLLAPKSGKALRTDIAEGAKLASDKTQQAASNVVEKTLRIASAVGEKTQAAAETIGRQASGWANKAKQAASNTKREANWHSLKREEELTAEASVAATTAERDDK